METLKAKVQRVIYNADDFYILSLKGGKSAKGNLALVPSPGDEFEFFGEWEENPKYGRQFAIAGASVPQPKTDSAIIDYIARVCDGIGPVRAAEIFGEFGSDSIEVLKKTPERACIIPGVTSEIAEDASRSLQENASAEEATFQLEELTGGLRISQATKLKLVRRFGGTFRESMKQDPYVLAEIPSIGFPTADKVAERVGITGDNPRRVVAGLSHTAMSENALLETASSLLGVDRGTVDFRLYESATDSRRFVIEQVEPAKSLVSLAHLRNAEQEIADRLLSLDSSETVDTSDPIPFDTSTLNPLQLEAVEAARANRVSLLTGGPGTGKTYTLTSILKLYGGQKVSLCAPTGKAAKRMAEQTGKAATTIHKLLEGAPLKRNDGSVGFDFKRNETNKLEGNVFIVDEVSMLDVHLFVKLLRAIPKRSDLVLVGDADQLPSIGPGSVLRDIIASGAIACTQLTEVMRQSEEGGLIVQACQDIRQGRPPKTENLEGGDLFFANVLDRERAAASIVSFVADRLPKALNVDPLRDIQVITALRKKTELGADELNLRLQDALNRNPAIKGTRFRLGDKVLQTKNDPSIGLMNGDLAFVVSINRDAKVLELVRFDDDPEAGERIEVSWNSKHLSLGYAVTVHRVPGSESPIVVAPVHSCAGPMLMQRNWLYTAISRARDVCVLVGDPKAAEDAVLRTSAAQRVTRLEALLRAETEVVVA